MIASWVDPDSALPPESELVLATCDGRTASLELVCLDERGNFIDRAGRVRPVRAWTRLPDPARRVDPITKKPA